MCGRAILSHNISYIIYNFKSDDHLLVRDVSKIWIKNYIQTICVRNRNFPVNILTLKWKFQSINHDFVQKSKYFLNIFF